VLTKNNVEIADIDDRRTHIILNFKHVKENYWKDQGVVWPEGHPAEGEDIILRDYQVEAINTFLDKPQSLKQIATRAGKTITTATL
jgi:superfamily II DNA or RNA helicase